MDLSINFDFFFIIFARDLQNTLTQIQTQNSNNQKI